VPARCAIDFPATGGFPNGGEFLVKVDAGAPHYRMSLYFPQTPWRPGSPWISAAPFISRDRPAPPAVLGGVQATINGTPLPLLYISGTQINAAATFGFVNISTASLAIAVKRQRIARIPSGCGPADPSGFQWRAQPGRYDRFTKQSNQGRIVRIGLCDGVGMECPGWRMARWRQRRMISIAV
jgi:hypothetical protein